MVPAPLCEVITYHYTCHIPCWLDASSGNFAVVIPSRTPSNPPVTIGPQGN